MSIHMHTPHFYTELVKNNPFPIILYRNPNPALPFTQSLLLSVAANKYSIDVYFPDLCYRVVDVNGWCLEQVISKHPVEIIDTSSGFFCDAPDTYV